MNCLQLWLLKSMCVSTFAITLSSFFGSHHNDSSRVASNCRELWLLKSFELFAGETNLKKKRSVQQACCEKSRKTDTHTNMLFELLVQLNQVFFSKMIRNSELTEIFCYFLKIVYCHLPIFFLQITVASETTVFLFCFHYYLHIFC